MGCEEGLNFSGWETFLIWLLLLLLLSPILLTILLLLIRMLLTLGSEDSDGSNGDGDEKEEEEEEAVVLSTTVRKVKLNLGPVNPWWTGDTLCRNSSWVRPNIATKSP